MTTIEAFRNLKNPAIISVGSIDGVLTSGAVLMLLGQRESAVPLVFTQAWTVDQIDVTSLPVQSEVILVDLAVNVKDPQMTSTFVRRLIGASHKIVAIIDEHGRAAWFGALAHAAGVASETITTSPLGYGSDYEGDSMSFAGFGLLVQPQGADRNRYPSSASVLREVAPTFPFPILLDNADDADRMIFTGIYSSIVNGCVKSATPKDRDARCIALSRAIAAGTLFSDPTIAGWMAEYASIEQSNVEVLASAEFTADCKIVSLDATGKQIDVSSVLNAAYSWKGVRVVSLRCAQFNPATKRVETLVNFGTKETGLDLIAILRSAGVPCGGFSQKANVSTDDSDRAMIAIMSAM